MPNTNLKYIVTRGKNKGEVGTPHIHEDGQIVVSKTRFEKDYIRVNPSEPLLEWLQKGYRVRMSAPGLAPSLINPASILGWR